MSASSIKGRTQVSSRSAGKRELVSIGGREVARAQLIFWGSAIVVQSLGDYSKAEERASHK